MGATYDESVWRDDFPDDFEGDTEYFVCHSLCDDIDRGAIHRFACECPGGIIRRLAYEVGFTEKELADATLARLTEALTAHHGPPKGRAKLSWTGDGVRLLLLRGTLNDDRAGHLEGVFVGLELI